MYVQVYFSVCVCVCVCVCVFMCECAFLDYKLRAIKQIFLFTLKVLMEGTVERDIPECASDPCQNLGTCIEETNRFSCHCADGYRYSSLFSFRRGRPTLRKIKCNKLPVKAFVKLTEIHSCIILFFPSETRHNTKFRCNLSC